MMTPEPNHPAEDASDASVGFPLHVLEGDASHAAVLDALPDPVVLCTPEGTIVHANRRTYEITGASDDELTGVNVAKGVPGEMRSRLQAKLNEVVETGSAQVEAPVLTGNGEVVPFEVTGSLVRQEGQELICAVARDVSERKAREEELEVRKERFRLLVNEVEEYAIFGLDREGCVETWNEGAEKIKGYTRDEIVGEHFSIFYPEEDVEAGKPNEALKVATREGQWIDENWRIRKDGSRFWARVTVTALRADGGQLRGFAKVVRDLSERRQREEELRQSEQRYRRLFEESQEGIAISTPEGKVIDANPAARQILGYDLEDFDDLDVRDLYVDPKERAEAREMMDEEGALYGLDVRLQRKDGEEIVCQLSSTPRRGPDGEIQVFQTFFRDVTEQKQMEEALRESERRHRRLFEESRDAVILTTPEGEIVDVNGAAEELFGYSRDTFLDLDAGELYEHPDEREQRIVPTLLEASTSSTLEARMRHKDGHTFRASASVTVHRDEDGEPELIQALVRDVTEYRQLQRDVLRAQEEERRRLGQDLHDGVASQLSGITLILSTAEQMLEEEHPAHSRLQKVQKLVKESGEDVRRLSRGLSPVHLSEVGLPAALGRLAENMEACRFKKEGDLSALSDEQKTHLYWIAQEAVTNARKYAEADEVVIRLRSTNDGGVLVVEDDGDGFDPSSIEKGGLGLRTMQYRADLLRGDISIDSAPGEGTRIECHLPASDF